MTRVEIGFALLFGVYLLLTGIFVVVSSAMDREVDELQRMVKRLEMMREIEREEDGEKDGET